jgi:PAS domain S-box-containing protein
MRLQTKIGLLFFVLSIGPLGVVGTVAYKDGEEALRRSLGVSFEQIAQGTIDRVDHSLYEVSRSVATWAGVDRMQEVVTGDVDAKIASFLISLQRAYGYFARLDAVNARGEIVASSQPDFIGRATGQTASVAQALAGRPALEDAHVDALSGKWVVTFGRPILATFEEGAVIGALIAHWDLEELVAMTQAAHENSEWRREVRILHRTGLLLCGPGARRGGALQRNLVEERQQSARRAAQQQRGFLVEQDEQGRAVLVGYAASRGYRDFPGLRWSVLVSEEAEAVFAPVAQLKTLIMRIGVGTAGVVLLVALMVGLTVARPVVTIAGVAEQVAGGNFTARVVHASGDELGALARSFNQMTESLQKTVVSRDALAKEVDERRRMEAALRGSEERFAAFMNNSPAVAWMKDEQGRHLYINATFTRIFQRSQEETLGKTAFELFPEAVARQLRANDEQVMASGSVLETYEHVPTPDGVMREWLVYKFPFQDASGKALVGGIAIDVTDRRKAEEALQREKDRLTQTNTIMMGREERILELKREVNALLVEMGKAHRYQA